MGVVPTIKDLGSRNGTWVNGHRIQEQPVGPGDVLRIGEWVGLVIELARHPPREDLLALGEGWFGGSRLASAIEPAARAANTDLPIVVQGETGVGKEGVARLVHARSGRRGAFLPVNCASIQAPMAEGELFGYRKGAFTGADRGSEGYFRAAHGGTLFLDEVVELALPVQAKLLRVLEQGEVQPLGEARPVRVDVRVISATQEPLSHAVADKRFRPDLLARLEGVTITLPPLRERREDIAPLFLRLLRDQSGGKPPDVDAKLIQSLLVYDWPLNVRELVVLARRLLGIYGTEPTLKRTMLPQRFMASPPAPKSTTRVAAPPKRSSTTDAEDFEALLGALRNERGNVSRAAAALGISRTRAYRLLDARSDFDVRSLRPEGEA